MFKALVKKQFSEIFSFIFIDKRKSKKRSAGAVALSIGLYLLLFGVIIANFYMLAKQLCAPLVSADLAWCYFALFGLAALLFGVIGSAFSTYNSLYVAKDNEMLFSMPIKPRTVLASRLVSVYLLSLMYVLLLFAPAVIAYLKLGTAGVMGTVLSILTPFVLACFASAVSCLLGYVIALIARRIKNKSFITLIVALIFLAGYYYFYFNMMGMLEKILASPLIIANAIRSYVYPFYLLGEGAAGDAVKFLLFSLICLGSALLVYFIVSLGFAKSVIAGSGVSHAKSKARYSEKSVREGSAASALFKKELLRFTSSANYMLNANIGLVFMLAAAVGLFIEGGKLQALLMGALSVNTDALALIACAAVCMLSSMNITTASSVSLEGRNIWIVKSLPIEPRSALLAKLKLHIALVLPPLALLLASVIFAFKFPLAHSLLICSISVLFVLFTALFGLVLNLKWANLNWTNEVMPIKQSLPVFVSMFGGFVMLLLLFALYRLLAASVEPLTFLYVTALALLAVCLLLYRLTVTWGARRFAELN